MRKRDYAYWSKLIVIVLASVSYGYFVYYNVLISLAVVPIVYIVYERVYAKRILFLDNYEEFIETISFCTVIISGMKLGMVYQHCLEDAKFKVGDTSRSEIENMLGIINKVGNIKEATDYYYLNHPYDFVNQIHSMIIQIDQTGLDNLVEPFELLQREIDQIYDDVQIHYQNKKSFNRSFILFFLMTLGLGLSIQFSFTSSTFYLRAIHTPWIALFYGLFILVNLFVFYQAECFYYKVVVDV